MKMAHKSSEMRKLITALESCIEFKPPIENNVYREVHLVCSKWSVAFQANEGNEELDEMLVWSKPLI